MYQKPKKSLGQNFLVDKNIQKKIITACELKITDRVLEIGAGNGELSAYIPEKVNRLYALEIDSSLCAQLKAKFKIHRNVRIINKDILKFDLRRYFSKLDGKIKVVGNIPYYITTPVIEYLLSYRDKIEDIFITVQKEFANRVIASAGSKEYGSLSCFVQYYTEPEMIFLIKKNSFYPIPKVDSSFLRLAVRKDCRCDLKEEHLLFRIIHASFKKRRKTLRNSLEGIMPENILKDFFMRYDINPNTRPEKFALNDFIALTRYALKSPSLSGSLACNKKY